MEEAKQRLSLGYTRTAPLYDAMAGPYYQSGIRRLLPRLRVPPLPAILDVGCGTGINLVEAARWFGPTRLLCGIDIAPGMIAVASSKLAALGIPAQLTVGDAEVLPYPDQLFDLVICNSVLHWFKDRGAALREMSRVLRPGGQLALICAAAPGFAEWFHLVKIVSAALLGSAPPAPSLPTGAEVAAWMTQAGLRIDHFVQPVEHRRTGNPRVFVRLLSTVAPFFVADLPERVWMMLEEELARRVALWPGGFRCTLSTVEAIGTRLR